MRPPEGDKSTGGAGALEYSTMRRGRRHSETPSEVTTVAQRFSCARTSRHPNHAAPSATACMWFVTSNSTMESFSAPVTEPTAAVPSRPPLTTSGWLFHVIFRAFHDDATALACKVRFWFGG